MAGCSSSWSWRSAACGIAPIYAAPELFEGLVSSFSDQYSLAIVYQEMLTGQRPIAGSNNRQLILEHTRGIPNLNPLPPSDRPALAGAGQEPRGPSPHL